MEKLVQVRCYPKVATYRKGLLIHYGDGASWGLLRALGFEVEETFEVPCPTPEEFDRPCGWWEPPKVLSDLRAQYQRYRTRVRDEKIIELRKELKCLLDRETAEVAEAAIKVEKSKKEGK